jgi:hypothetical protein
MIRREAPKGVNFAGHYRIIELGCGPGCERVAVIDVESGKVYEPWGSIPSSEFYIGLHVKNDKTGLFYEIGSKLLVARGCIQSGYCAAFYYEWTVSAFKLLQSDPIPPLAGARQLVVRRIKRWPTPISISGRLVIPPDTALTYPAVTLFLRFDWYDKLPVLIGRDQSVDGSFRLRAWGGGDYELHIEGGGRFESDVRHFEIRGEDTIDLGEITLELLPPPPPFVLLPPPPWNLPNFFSAVPPDPPRPKDRGKK